MGLLVDTLKESGVYDSTCIVITGDHGCDLNWKKHCQYALYEERVHVPLYIKYPSWSKFRLEPSRRVNTVAEIHRLIYGLTDGFLPEYFNKLPQYDSAFSEFVFSETIMNPKRVRDRHMMAISDGAYKYVCRNRIDWDRAKILEKQEEFLYRYSSAYDINETKNLADIEPEKRRYYSDRAYEALERNLAFLKKFPTKKF
jgi:arylsulfatase A-like enzyme